MSTDATPQVESTPSEQPPKPVHVRPLGRCGALAGNRIERLWAGQEKSSIRGVLAHLRRSVYAEPGSVPEIWDWTISGVSPEARTDKATREEHAVHLALCLYAVHQQSRPEPMDSRAKPFGAAVRQLADAERGDSLPLETPVYRRFIEAATSTTFEETATQLRGIISQLRAAKIPCDHAALADDFFGLQFPDRRVTVLRKWARDFDRIKSTDSANTSTPDNSKE